LTAALPVADISLRMRITPHPSATPRFRCFRPQVERPRLRPSWRIALTAAVATVSITLLYLGERAAIDALVGGEFAAPVGRTIARAEERALDALLTRVDAERKEDEERARRIAAEHIDPQSCELRALARATLGRAVGGAESDPPLAGPPTDLKHCLAGAAVAG
jgi:hypothetical protein